jgi:hypothetical protein
MAHPDDPGPWRERFNCALRFIGCAAARLPYGVPEPVLGGHAAIELYSGGLLSSLDLELLTADPRRLQAELMATGFRRNEYCSRNAWTLWHPALELGVNIAVQPPVDANVVVVEVGTKEAHDVATIRVIGIEDLIADQITGWLAQGRPRGAITTLIQVLIELGRAGIAGPFRPAHLQRRLARETGGEAVLELPLAPYGLDDPAPRMTSLTSIASVARSWRASRNLPLDAADLFGGAHRTDRSPSGIRNRNEITKRGGLGVETAQIIPFRPDGR